MKIEEQENQKTKIKNGRERERNLPSVLQFSEGFFTAGGCDQESRGERKRKSRGERKKESQGERKMRDGY